MKEIHKLGKHTKTPPGMFELNLNLLFTNTSHGLLNELCAASLTRNVTEYTFERQNRACGIVLWNNFTGVNDRGGLKSCNRKKVTLSLELLRHLLASCPLSSTSFPPPYGSFTSEVRQQREGQEESENRKEGHNKSGSLSMTAEGLQRRSKLRAGYRNT